jgi:alkylmercury lyase
MSDPFFSVESGQDDQKMHAMKLVAESFSPMSSEGQKLSLLVYRLLGEGIPVDMKRIAKMSGKTLSTILASLNGPGNDIHHIEYDARQRIIGFGGLSLTPSPHRFRIGGKMLYAWCAWDTLFLPELLQKTAHIASGCPLTGGEISLTVTPKEIRRYFPLSAVMSFRIPTRAIIQDADIIHRFCCDIRFHANRNLAQQWISEKKDVVIFDMEEAFSLAKFANAIRYSECLPLDRRQTRKKQENV